MLTTSEITPPPIVWGAQAPRPARKRKASICPTFCAKPQTKLKIRNHYPKHQHLYCLQQWKLHTTLANCKTTTRPYTSLSGARKRGPTTNASKKIENINSVTIVEWTLRSLSIACSAGAIMDDAMGVMNVIKDTSPVTNHFLLNDHVFGFAGSVGSSQVTYEEDSGQ
jgi:hypothetical protein